MQTSDEPFIPYHFNLPNDGTALSDSLPVIIELDPHPSMYYTCILTWDVAECGITGYPMVKAETAAEKQQRGKKIAAYISGAVRENNISYITLQGLQNDSEFLREILKSLEEEHEDFAVVTNDDSRSVILNGCAIIHNGYQQQTVQEIGPLKGICAEFQYRKSGKTHTLQVASIKLPPAPIKTTQQNLQQFFDVNKDIATIVAGDMGVNVPPNSKTGSVITGVSAIKVGDHFQQFPTHRVTAYCQIESFFLPISTKGLYRDSYATSSELVLEDVVEIGTNLNLDFEIKNSVQKQIAMICRPTLQFPCIVPETVIVKGQTYTFQEYAQRLADYFPMVILQSCQDQHAVDNYEKLASTLSPRLYQDLISQSFRIQYHFNAIKEKKLALILHSQVYHTLCFFKDGTIDKVMFQGCVPCEGLTVLVPDSLIDNIDQKLVSLSPCVARYAWNTELFKLVEVVNTMQDDSPIDQAVKDSFSKLVSHLLMDQSLTEDMLNNQAYKAIIKTMTLLAHRVMNQSEMMTLETIEVIFCQLDREMYGQEPHPKTQMLIFGIIGAILGTVLGGTIAAGITAWAGGIGGFAGAIAGAFAGWTVVTSAGVGGLTLGGLVAGTLGFYGGKKAHIAWSDHKSTIVERSTVDVLNGIKEELIACVTPAA